MNKFWQQWEDDPWILMLGFMVFCWGVSDIIKAIVGK